MGIVGFRSADVRVFRVTTVDNWNAHDLSAHLHDVDLLHRYLLLLVSPILREFLASIDPSGLEGTESERSKRAIASDLASTLAIQAERQSGVLRVRRIQIASPGIAEYEGIAVVIRVLAKLAAVFRKQRSADRTTEGQLHLGADALAVRERLGAAQIRADERLGALEVGARIVEALHGDPQLEAASLVLEQLARVIDTSLDREFANELVGVTFRRVEKSADRLADDPHIIEISEVPTDAGAADA